MQAMHWTIFDTGVVSMTPCHIFNALRSMGG